MIDMDPTRAPALAPDLDRVPPEIRESTRVVVWHYEERDGTPTKVPDVPSDPSRRASVTDPSTWDEFAVARAAFEDGKCDGVGFVLGDGVVGVDLDKCRDPETGTIDPSALGIIKRLNSYTEVSPSGRGVHCLARGTLPPGRRRKGTVEMYCDGRYFTVTGAHLADTPTSIESRTTELTAVHADLFGSSGTNGQRLATATPRLAVTALSDERLLRIARSARNGEAIDRLLAGDRSGYTSPSEADLALCNHLAFYAHGDDGQIDRIFRSSGLMRDKWDRRLGDTTYGATTIQQAIAGCHETYRPIADGLCLHVNDTRTATPRATQEDDAPVSSALPDFLQQASALPAREELIPGLIAKRETSLIHGAPRGLKTWGLLEIGLAITTRTPAFGLLTPPAAGRVLYVTNEDGMATLGARLRGLLAGRGLTQAPEGFRLLVHQGVTLDDPEWQARLIAEIRRFAIDLVMLDPMRSVTSAVDQGPREFQPVGSYLRTLINETGAGTLCSHHDTKPQLGVAETRRRAQRVSGGGLFSYMDAPIHASTAGDGKTLLVPDGFKHTEDPPPILFELRVEPDGVFRLVAEETTGRNPNEIELHAAILEHLRQSGGSSGRGITDAVQRRKQDVADALEILEQRGIVDCTDGPRRAKLWCLQ